MGVDENYHDNLEHLATHPDLLPQEAQECGISDENKELLHKAGAICTLMAATKNSIPTATRNTQTAVAALLLLKSMARGTQKSSSHRRSVLGDKGCTLHTVEKGTYRGPDPSPLDKWITDRRARIRTVRAAQCCILSSHG